MPIDQKLFKRLVVSSEDPDVIDVLWLLSKAQQSPPVIDDLWRQYFVDRQIKNALVGLFGPEPDPGLASESRLVRSGRSWRRRWRSRDVDQGRAEGRAVLRDVQVALSGRSVERYQRVADPLAALRRWHRAGRAGCLHEEQTRRRAEHSTAEINTDRHTAGTRDGVQCSRRGGGAVCSC